MPSSLSIIMVTYLENQLFHLNAVAICLLNMQCKDCFQKNQMFLALEFCY